MCDKSLWVWETVVVVGNFQKGKEIQGDSRSQEIPKDEGWPAAVLFSDGPHFLNDISSHIECLISI